MPKGVLCHPPEKQTSEYEGDKYTLIFKYIQFRSANFYLLDIVDYGRTVKCAAAPNMSTVCLEIKYVHVKFAPFVQKSPTKPPVLKKAVNGVNAVEGTVPILGPGVFIATLQTLVLRFCFPILSNSF